MEYCEELVLEWASGVRSQWYKVPEMQQVYKNRMINRAMEVSTLSDLFPRGTVSVTQLLTYCERKTLAPKTRVISEGDRVLKLFIMQQGRIKCFTLRCVFYTKTTRFLAFLH